MIQNNTAKNNANGWLSKLSLSFANRFGNGELQRTELVDRQQQGPLTIQRPFYPEGKPCHIYLLHPPGGIVGGDKLELDIFLDHDSHLLMTMPGASKYYRSHNNIAQLKQKVTLASDSIIEWLPQENIFFNGSNANLTTEFNLALGSRLLGWENLCFGRPVMHEKFEQGNIKSRLTINLPDELGLDEHLKIINGNCAPIGNYTYSATLFAYPIDPTILQLVQKRLEDSIIPIGATALGQLLIVRLLANDNQICQQYLQRLWSLLRPLIINLPACPPRIWAT